MALISLRQLLDHAADHNYGLPAFNINNLEMIQAVMEAADETNAPVIIQVSRGARVYAGDPFLRYLFKAALESYPHLPVCIHQDHGNNPHTCCTAIANNFSSVMMDGSLEEDGKTPASYSYNVEVTKKMCGIAHQFGVSVEGELGCLGSLETGQGEEEDGHGFQGTLPKEKLLTDPEQAVDFVKETQVDALAVAIGTSHGAYKFTKKPDKHVLSMDTIKAINRKMPSLHMVMHGSSSVPKELQDIINDHGGVIKPTFGVPIEEIQEGIRWGVRKVNIDTDCRMAMTGQIRKVLMEKKSEFDLRKILKPAMTKMKETCKNRLESFGASGKADKIKPLSLNLMISRYQTQELDHQFH